MCAVRKNTAGFLNLGFIDILDPIILCCGGEGCPVHGRMLSDILASYSLHASSIPVQLRTTRFVSRHCQNIPWGRIAHEDTGKWEKLKKKIISTHDIDFYKAAKEKVWAALQVKETPSQTQGHLLGTELLWRQQADTFLRTRKLVKDQ